MRGLVRLGRRVRGGIEARRAEVEGSTATAVISALQKATLGRPTAEEQVWIDRIERMRVSLAASVEPLEIEDFGAGKRDTDNSQETRTVTTTARTLGNMTESSKPRRWAYLLFCLIREFRPETGLEMGACVGISASYQAAAMELNGTGRLITLEGSAVLAQRSIQTIKDLGLADRASVRLGSFADTLADSVAELRPVQWAFIDGHHAEAATLEYTDAILPQMASEAIVVYDDINWSPGMRNAWQRVVADPRYALTVDLRSLGVAVVTSHSAKKQALSVSYG